MTKRTPVEKSLRERFKHWRSIALSSAKRLSQVDAFDLAGSLTLTTVLAIVPLLAVALALFTAFPQFHEFSEALQAFLTNSLMPPVVSDNVMSYLNQFAQQASRLTAIGGGFLVVTVLLLVLSVDKAFNEIWRVTRSRSISQRLLVYWTLLTLGPLMTGASLWATAIVARESFGVISQMPDFLEMALKTSPFVVSAIGFAALFIIVPNTRVATRDAVAGGVLVAVLLELMKFGFAFYVSKISTYTTIYGAFAALPVFLIWVYLSWLSILFGAIVAANLPYMRQIHLRKIEQPGDLLRDALAIMELLDHARTHIPPGINTDRLAEQLHLPLDRMETLLNSLQRLGLIAITHSRKREQWVIVCNLETTSLSVLIEHFLLQRTTLGLDKHPALRQALSDFIADGKNTMLAEVMMLNDNTEPQALQSGISSTQEAHHAKGQ
jgi:membrane protein